MRLFCGESRTSKIEGTSSTVYILGYCLDCYFDEIVLNDWSNMLFLQHIKKILKYVYMLIAISVVIFVQDLSLFFYNLEIFLFMGAVLHFPPTFCQ